MSAAPSLRGRKKCIWRLPSYSPLFGHSLEDEPNQKEEQTGKGGGEKGAQRLESCRTVVTHFASPHSPHPSPPPSWWTMTPHAPSGTSLLGLEGGGGELSPIPFGLGERIMSIMGAAAERHGGFRDPIRCEGKLMSQKVIKVVGGNHFVVYCFFPFPPFRWRPWGRERRGSLIHLRLAVRLFPGVPQPWVKYPEWRWSCPWSNDEHV